MKAISDIRNMGRSAFWAVLSIVTLIGLTQEARGQAIRFDSVAQTVNAQCVPGALCPTLSVPGATVSVYTSPTLTTPATTYTSASASSPCPSYAPVTPSTGSTACTSSSDNQGNFGFWIGSGTFYYTVSYPAAAGGGTRGPYAFTAGVSGGNIAPGSDTQVIYNKGGSLAADANFQWLYGSQSLALNSPSGNVSAVFSNGGTAKWSITSGASGFSLTDNTASQSIITVGSGSNQSINFVPTSGNVNFTGTADTPGISLLGGAFVFSTGGFLSQANSWQGVNSLTDGALMRGYGLAPNSGNTAGGYFDFAPVTYNPHGGGGCTDANGNPVQQPLPLNGLSSFGTHDTIMWVTQSPQMPPSGACGAIIPVEEYWGLAINSYLFARGGLATDNALYNSINTMYLSGGVPSGGVEANTHISGTLYPIGTVTTTGTLSVATYLGGHMVMGHSTGDPAAGTIATTTNPLSTGEGLIQGMFYFNDTSGHPKYYNGSAWIDWTGGGGGSGCTPPGVNKAILSDNGAGGCTGNNLFTYTSGTSVSLGNASFITVGTGAGFDASTCTAANCIQSPSGGIFLGTTLTWTEIAAPSVSNSGQDTVFASSSTHQLMWSGNASTPYAPIAPVSGTVTNGHCAQITVSAGVTTITDAGGACTTGGGGGTVVASPQYQLPYYSSAGTSATVTGTSGLTYQPSVGTLTISGGSAAGIAMTSFSLTAAGVMQLTATGSNVDLTAATAYNAFQAPNGGIGNTLSGTFINYIQPGSYSGATGSGPAATTSDTFHAGAFSYSTVGSCLAMYNGSTWACFGSGGGSGTVTSASQWQVAVYPNNGTVVQGYSGFTWNNSTTTLNVTGTGITTSGSVSAVGVFQSTGGSGSFAVTTDTAYNSFTSVGGAALCTSGTCTGGPAIQVGSSAQWQVSKLGAETAAGLTLSSITGSTQCLQVNSSGVVSGTGASCGGSGGVTSITGTANQVIASASTGAVTLSLPQSIATTSSVTFASVVANGAFNSTVSTSSIAFQVQNGLGTPFQVDGYGDVSSAGSVNATGNSTLGLCPYRVSGACVIDLLGNWQGGGSTAWTSYTPTTTGLSSTTISSDYQVIGKICFVRIYVIGTSTGAALSVTLPLAPKSGTQSFNVGVVNGTGGGTCSTACSGLNIVTLASSTTLPLGTYSSGPLIVISYNGTYEIN